MKLCKWIRQSFCVHHWTRFDNPWELTTPQLEKVVWESTRAWRCDKCEKVIVKPDSWRPINYKEE